MTDLIPTSKNQPTMSSIELLDMVNASREENGESPIRRNDFHARVADELAGEFYETFVIPSGPGGGRPSQGFRLNHDQCLLVSMRESKAVRRSILKKLKALEGNQDHALPQTLPEALRLAADMAEQNAQLTVANQQQADEIKALRNLFTDGMTPAQFAKRLNGVNCQKISQELARRGWLYEDFAGGWRVASYARDRYLTERQSNIPRSSGQVMLRCTPVLLREGAVRLHKLYLAGELPMKASWNGVFTHDKTIDEKVA